MKTYSITFIFCLVASLGWAQKKGAIIHPKKIYIKYQGNMNRDSLIIPVVSNKYPALKQALSEESLFNGDKLDSVIKEYKEEGHGITGLWYQITYLDARIISIILNYETMGAYPDSYQTWLTLDIATGKLHALAKEIIPAGLTKIFNQYRYTLNKRLRNLQKEIAEDKELDKDDVNEIMTSLKTSVSRLKPGDVFEKYVFTKTGVMITSDNALPHLMRNYELWRNWSIPYIKLHPYKTTTAVVIK